MKYTCKLYKCPYPHCGLFFPIKLDLQIHMSMQAHCPACGFAIGISMFNESASKRFCPACKLENIIFPKDKLKGC